MSSSMKAYLAEKYMSGPKADAILAHSAAPLKKKKKRKATTDPSSSTSALQGAKIVDDDDSGWKHAGIEDEDDDMKEAVVEKDRGFKKRKLGDMKDVRKGEEEGGWATVREPTPPPAPPADEEPLVVETEEMEPTKTAPRRGGLVTAKQLRKERESKPQQEEDVQMSREDIERAQETVYRDTSGRKIDMKAEKAEAARKKREREEKEAQKMQWGKGLVQREEEEERRKKEEAMRGRDFVRYADDAELNREQKETERWNDPAAAFLTSKKSKGPRKPEYTGPPPPPNRFGIKPGYRWDGVDRSNGFEKKLFQRINERKRVGQESHNWSVEDM